MFHVLRIGALITALAAPVLAEDAAPYDLLFRNGTLDDIAPGTELVYQRAITNALKPDAATRDSGQISLSFPPDLDDMAQLELRQGEKFRRLGVFPASVGNPMIMYFYESVVRDMSESTGGSPYYVRNRVKEALVQPVEIQDGMAEYDGKQIAVKTVQLAPFAGDSNADRMQGFGDLTLTVTMSDAVPGWYLSLVADAGEVYHSEVQFDRVEGK